MTNPSIFDITSAWNYLWYISMAIMIVAWAIITAAAIPYLAARAMAKPGQRHRPTTSGRTLIIAAVAVIILMAGIVTGLAYGIGAAKDQDLIGRLSAHRVAGARQKPRQLRKTQSVIVICRLGT